MKKIGLLALAIVLSLGLVGVGFAHWTETLNISGTADTGNFIVTFDNGGGADGWTSPTTGETVHLRGLVSNDDAVSDEAIWCNGPLRDPMVPDPDDDGGDPTAAQTMGVNVARLGNHASTSVSLCDTGHILRNVTVTLENAYPSYWPTVFFSIRNWGTIPAKVQSIRLIQVSKDPTPEDLASGDEIVCAVDIPLEVCDRWYVHFNQVEKTCDVNDVEECAAFSLHLSDDEGRLFEVLAAGSGVMGEHGQFESAVCGNLDIHVLQHAEELVLYDFVIEIVVVPFNK